MRLPPPKIAQRAFSLLDLLVTIVLIAVLGALAFVTSRFSIEKAREITCAQRIRSLSVAIFQYQADHDGRLPGARVEGQGSNLTNTWGPLLYPYMGILVAPQKKMHPDMARHLSCPSEKTKEAWAPPSEYWHSHYGVNASGPKTFGYTGDSNRPKVEQYASTMMLIESSNCRALRARPAPLATIAYRHNDRAHVIFFDGHLEKRTKEEIPTDPLSLFWFE